MIGFNEEEEEEMSDFSYGGVACELRTPLQMSQVRLSLLFS
jgi:hypothetical protein